MKRVIYTCITGGYDKLRQPEVLDGDFDYICFTDAVGRSEEGVWQIRPIPYSCDDPTRLSRYVKLLPHKVLGEYDESLWIDANIAIRGNGIYDAVRRASSSRSLVKVQTRLNFLGRRASDGYSKTNVPKFSSWSTPFVYGDQL